MKWYKLYNDFFLYYLNRLYSVCFYFSTFLLSVLPNLSGNIDTPINPSSKGNRSIGRAHLFGMTQTWKNKEEEQQQQQRQEQQQQSNTSNLKFNGKNWPHIGVFKIFGNWFDDLDSKLNYKSHRNTENYKRKKQTNTNSTRKKNFQTDDSHYITVLLLPVQFSLIFVVASRTFSRREKKFSKNADE